MWDMIVNPETGRLVNVKGKIGINILQKYVEYMSGGSLYEGTFAAKARKKAENSYKPMNTVEKAAWRKILDESKLKRDKIHKKKQKEKKLLESKRNKEMNKAYKERYEEYQRKKEQQDAADEEERIRVSTEMDDMFFEEMENPDTQVPSPEADLSEYQKALRKFITIK
jgi:hypothetical protein